MHLRGSGKRPPSPDKRLHPPRPSSASTEKPPPTHGSNQPTHSSGFPLRCTSQSGQIAAVILWLALLFVAYLVYATGLMNNNATFSVPVDLKPPPPTVSRTNGKDRNVVSNVAPKADYGAVPKTSMNSASDDAVVATTKVQAENIDAATKRDDRPDRIDEASKLEATTAHENDDTTKDESLKDAQRRDDTSMVSNAAINASNDGTKDHDASLKSVEIVLTEEHVVRLEAERAASSTVDDAKRDGLQTKDTATAMYDNMKGNADHDAASKDSVKRGDIETPKERPLKDEKPADDDQRSVGETAKDEANPGKESDPRSIVVAEASSLLEGTPKTKALLDEKRGASSDIAMKDNEALGSSKVEVASTHSSTEKWGARRSSRMNFTAKSSNGVDTALGVERLEDLKWQEIIENRNLGFSRYSPDERRKTARRRFAERDLSHASRRGYPQRVKLTEGVETVVIKENPNPRWQCICVSDKALADALHPATIFGPSGDLPSSLEQQVQINGTGENNTSLDAAGYRIAEANHNITDALAIRVLPCRNSAYFQGSRYAICNRSAAYSPPNNSIIAGNKSAYNPSDVRPCAEIDAIIASNASRLLQDEYSDEEYHFGRRRKRYEVLMERPAPVVSLRCKCAAGPATDTLAEKKETNNTIASNMMTTSSSPAAAEPIALVVNATHESFLSVMQTKMSEEEFNSMKELFAQQFERASGYYHDIYFRSGQGMEQQLLAKKRKLQNATKPELMKMMTERCDSGGRAIEIAQCLKEDQEDEKASLLPHISELAVHSITSLSMLACYAKNDMVCKVVGQTGGWETELLFILQHAMRHLRYEVRFAATLLRRMLEGNPTAPPPTTTTTTGATSADATTAANPSKTGVFALPFLLVNHELRSWSLDSEFALSFSPDTPENAPYSKHDVEFVDIGGNVGVFTYHLWKNGYNVRVFEALPSNVRLLRLSRCLNYREEVKRWEIERNRRHHGLVSRLKDMMRREMTRDKMEKTEIEEFISNSTTRFEDEAYSRLPVYYRTAPEDKAEDVLSLHGPIFNDVSVLHAALGPHRHGTGPSECVMVSEENNFGDVVMFCDNATLIEEAREIAASPGTAHRILRSYLPRGFVSLTDLDTIVMGSAGEDRGEAVIDLDEIVSNGGWDHRNAALMKRLKVQNMSRELLETAANVHRRTPVIVNRTERYQNVKHMSTVDRRKFFGQTFVNPEMSAAELLAFALTKQYIMKIDVEGHEQFVLEGASKWLSNPAIRPKLILSEIWRKRNITKYSEMMIERMGYVGYCLADGLWIRNISQAAMFHQFMPREMDTIIWVLPGFEFLLPSTLRETPSQEPTKPKPPRHQVSGHKEAERRFVHA